MSLVPRVTLQPFDKLEIDFIGHINPPRKRTGARYIITTTNYLMIWDEEAPIMDFTSTATTGFLFDNVVTQFGCPKILMSDQGSHFINQAIRAMTK